METTKKTYSRAKTILAHWLDQVNTSVELRQDILSALDRVRDELPKRDDWFDIDTTSLDDTRSLKTELFTPLLRIGSWSGGLFVATVTPGWSVGWRPILGEGEQYDILSWLIHYVKQYIRRSLIASVLISLCEQHNLLLNPFGSVFSSRRYGPMIPVISKDKALEEIVLEPLIVNNDIVTCEYNQTFDPTEIEVSTEWIVRNTLDPLVHQAIFHLLRAKALTANGFYMEAVVAFDCVLEIVRCFVVDRGVTSTQPSRAKCADILGLGEDAKETAEFSGFLRNHFGAHSGGWRWWDFHEMFEKDVIAISDLATNFVREMADLEPNYRVIDPTPERWSDWFWINFKSLWRAVWFEAMTTKINSRAK